MPFRESYFATKKVGGLRFVRIGRFGMSFYVSKRSKPRTSERALPLKVRCRITPNGKFADYFVR